MSPLTVSPVPVPLTLRLALPPSVRPPESVAAPAELPIVPVVMVTGAVTSAPPTMSSAFAPTAMVPLPAPLPAPLMRSRPAETVVPPPYVLLAASKTVPPVTLTASPAPVDGLKGMTRLTVSVPAPPARLSVPASATVSVPPARMPSPVLLLMVLALAAVMVLDRLLPFRRSSVEPGPARAMPAATSPVAPMASVAPAATVVVPV